MRTIVEPSEQGHGRRAASLSHPRLRYSARPPGRAEPGALTSGGICNGLAGRAGRAVRPQPSSPAGAELSRARRRTLPLPRDLDSPFELAISRQKVPPVPRGRACFRSTRRRAEAAQVIARAATHSVRGKFKVAGCVTHRLKIHFPSAKGSRLARRAQCDALCSPGTAVARVLVKLGKRHGPALFVTK